MPNKRKDTEFEDHFGQPKKNKGLAFLKVAGFSLVVLFSAGSTLAIIAQKKGAASVQVEPGSSTASLTGIPFTTPTPACKYPEFTPESIASAVNEYRSGKGKPQLLVSAPLAKFSQSQAESLAPTDKSKLGADTKLPSFYSWQTSKIKSGERISLSEYNVVWNWNQRSVCDFIAALSQNSQADQTVLKASYDTIGAGFKDSFIFIAIGSRQTAAQAAESDRQSQDALRDSLNDKLTTSAALKLEAERAQSAYEATKARNEAAQKEQEEKKKMDEEDQLKKQYAAVLLGIAADSVSHGHSSASSSNTGFTTFGGSGKVSSASNSKLGFTAFGYIGDRLSSMSSSDLGYYSCSYIGERLSSCSGSGNYISFSYIGENLSSAYGGGLFVSFSGYQGISSASVSGDFYSVN